MNELLHRSRMLLTTALVATATVVVGVTAAMAAPAVKTVVYDDFQKSGGYTLGDYGSKWSNIYGLGDMAAGPDTRSFADGSFYIDDAPYRTAADFSVFDHLKYIAVSNQSFDVPENGSLTF